MRYYANKDKKEKGTLSNLSFNPEQEKSIIKVAGHLGLLMMERYIALATLPRPVLEDSTLAAMLSVSERTIRATRTKLTKAGWFKRNTYTSNGEQCVTYDVGQKAVRSNTSVNIKL